MSLVSCILFVLSIVIICIYIGVPTGDIDDDEAEFTLFDLIILIASIIYVVWFFFTYVTSYLG